MTLHFVPQINWTCEPTQHASDSNGVTNLLWNRQPVVKDLDSKMMRASWMTVVQTLTTAAIAPTISIVRQTILMLVVKSYLWNTINTHCAKLWAIILRARKRWIHLRRLKTYSCSWHGEDDKKYLSNPDVLIFTCMLFNIGQSQHRTQHRISFQARS